MAETASPIKQTEAILHAQDYLQILRSRWKEALFVFFLVFASCAVITHITTPTYKSMMRFEVKPPRDLINIAVGGDANPIQTMMSESYMQTEFEAMVSENNLLAIANKLDLPNEWGTSEQGAAGMLAGMITVMPVRGTNLVDVTVRNSDPRVAQRVCEAVADCYKEVREGKENDIINDAIAKRYEVLRSRQDILEAKADVVRQYIRSGKYLKRIWAESGRAPLETLASEEQVVNQLTSQRLTLESEIAQMTVHISQLQKLRDKDLLSYVTRTGLLTAESYCSARVRSLNEAYRSEEEKRKEMLMNGYGERHPNILILDEQHATTQQQLLEELVGMRSAMVDQLEVKKSELADVEARFNEARNNLRDKTLEDQKVMTALQEYNAEKARYDKLEQDYIVDKMRLMSPRKTIEIFSRPVAAGAPSSPNIKLNLTVGAVAGVIAGIVVAVIYNFFDTSIRSLEDAERQLQLPVLGVIPQDAGLLIQHEGDNPDAEAYRILRTNIELKKALFKSRTYVVVSANAGEGKTTTMINLAYVFASAGYSTLMIDADMRRPRLARYAGVDSSVGLSNYLTSDMELKDAVFKTSTPNLYIMPSGPMPSDPSGILSSYRMDQLLSETGRRFDIVFFDSPPVLGVSEASILASKVDAALLVLQPRKMPIKALLRTKAVIENVGGQIMGLIMNNVDISADSQYQYYTTYYSYYNSDNVQKEKKMGKHHARRGEHVESVTEQKSKAVSVAETTTSKNEEDDLY